MVALESNRLFCHLGAQKLAEVHCAIREATFTPGEQIFKEGDEAGEVYIVKEGLVEISGLVNQQRHIFSSIPEGDMFGEMAILTDKPRSACAIASKVTTVYVIPHDYMMELLNSDPVLSLSLLREICSRLREFNRHYVREVLQAERLSIIGRFARSIVHDLKNPMTIIALTAEKVGLANSNPEVCQQAKPVIIRQVERIMDLVSQILEFTQGPQANPSMDLVDYAAFVAHVLEEIRPEAALKSVTIEVAGELPAVRMLLNPKRLKRVFDNLIHNAIDVMPTGGKLRIRFLLNPTEVVTEIEDSGPGIAPEIAGRLFEAFATYGKAHGTGLGLSICKQIVQDHKGWISARNSPNGGAIFSFGLALPPAA